MAPARVWLLLRSAADRLHAMSELSDRLDLAVRLVREAGQHALTYYMSDSMGLEFKADRTPVTRADREGEELIRRALDAEYSADAVSGEEFGEKAGSSGYRWYIDPIDGTESFVRGVPLFGVLAGIERAGEVVAGAVYFPALREIAYAAIGSGAWWARGVGASSLAEPLRPMRARVSPVARLAEATLCATGLQNFAAIGKAEGFARLLSAVKHARGWSDCYGHYLVATGRTDIMIDPYLGAWDCAALLPIVAEAGGCFSSLRNEPHIFGGSGISTNGLLHSAVLAALD